MRSFLSREGESSIRTSGALVGHGGGSMCSLRQSGLLEFSDSLSNDRMTG